MSRRAGLQLGEPGDLRGYPTTKAGATFRAHHKDHGPWWFASAPADPEEGGRFDLPAPEGTCYVASSADCAVRERYGRVIEHGMVVDDPLWRDTRVAVLDPLERPEAGLPLGNARAQAAADHHTSELATCTPYGLTRRWAAAFRSAGLGGLRYAARFSPGAGVYAEAWFGPAGAGELGPAGAGEPGLPWREASGWRERYRVVSATFRVRRGTVLG